MNFHLPATLYGMRVVIQPDTYRTLPTEVMPGVPWPPGFREEINTWMRDFFRPYNMMPDGAVWTAPGDNLIYMNPRTHLKLASALKEVRS